MKILVTSTLVLLGMYWLFDHYPPMPFNHEQLGLYFHTIHRIMGLIFFIVAGVVWFKWSSKEK